jgi:polysaccharide chain length determinant protein (PEP-CTERM system associated)
MIDLIEKITGAGRELWRARWIGIATAATVLGLCLLFVLTMKDRYESSARIYIDTQSVLKPLLAGMTVQPDVDQQIRMLARTLISRPNVERLRASPEIGWDSLEQADRERDIEPLMQKIKVVPTGGGNIYSISFRDTDPARATRLVQTMVTMFVSASGTDKRKNSEEARSFIDEQIAQHETKLAKSENALKEFKLRHFGVAGVSNQDYFSRMSALSDEVNKTRLELSAAERSRDALKAQLETESPRVMVDPSLVGAGVQLSETEIRLQTQKKLLDDLLRRYTDAHPEVVNVRDQIAGLESQKQREQADTAKREALNPAAGNNPVFQRLRIGYAEADANVAALRVRLGIQQKSLDDVRGVANKVPQVEAELAQLNRDYEVIRKNYEQLVTRRESASLGVKIDESLPIADFRIVDPPRAAPMPVMPNRMAVAALGLLAAAAAGVAAAWLAVRLKPRVHRSHQLALVTGRPVIGSVTLLTSPGTVGLARADTRRLLLVAAGLIVAQLGWLAWLAIQSRIA